jgi:hypothetical protein
MGVFLSVVICPRRGQCAMEKGLGSVRHGIRDHLAVPVGAPLGGLLFVDGPVPDSSGGVAQHLLPPVADGALSMAPETGTLGGRPDEPAAPQVSAL